MGQIFKRSLLLAFLLPALGFADTGFKDLIQFTETDGAPKCMAGQVKVTAGTLTCSGQTATITTGGGSGGGGSSALAVQVGATQISSPTANIIFNSQGFTGSLGSASTSYINLNPATTDFIHNQGTAQASSIFNVSSGTASNLNVTFGVIAGTGTFQRVQITSNTILGSGTTIYASGQGVFGGPLSATNLSGTNTGDQTITLTGDITGSGAGSFATTAAAIQGNVRTFTSSITVTGAGGIGATYGVLSGSVTTGIVQVSSNSILANTTFYQDGTIIMGSTTIKAAATDYILSVSSANAIVLFGFQDNGGFVSSGTLPTLSSCGTGPALSVGSSNFSGTITGGATSGGCTLTFASGGFTNVPTCVISNQTMSVVNAMTYTVSATALTVTETGLGTSKIDYICLGH